jgi:plastocyanin
MGSSGSATSIPASPLALCVRSVPGMKEAVSVTDTMSARDQEPTEDAAARQSRRHLLRRTAGGAGLLALAGTGAFGLRQATAKDDDDDDDDDNSGHGGGDDDHDNSGHDGGDDDEPAITGEIPAGSIEVRITDDDADGFSPGQLTVDLGQPVTFVNADHHDHTATGSGFDTGIMQPGQTATVILDKPGTFPYACQIHPEMTGSIAVRDENGEVPAPSRGASTPAASPVAESASPDNVLVSILDFSFDPVTLEIPAGTTVTWLNDGEAPHTATAEDGSFDTGQLDPGQQAGHTFDQPGTHNYACAFHPQMVGAIVVT